MKPILLILPLLLFACCTRSAIQPPGLAPQGAVPRAVEVGDAAGRVREASAAVDTAAAGIELRAGLISRETRSLRQSLNDATAEADRLRKNEGRTIEEMNQMWMRLTDITRRSILLEDEALAAVKALDESRELRRQATVEIVQLQQDAAKKDQEASALRLQLADETERMRVTHQLATENASAFQLAKQKADKLKGRIFLYDVVFICLLLLAGVLCFLRWGLPAMRRGAIGV